MLKKIRFNIRTEQNTPDINIEKYNEKNKFNMSDIGINKELEKRIEIKTPILDKYNEKNRFNILMKKNSSNINIGRISENNRFNISDIGKNKEIEIKTPIIDKYNEINRFNIRAEKNSPDITIRKYNEKKEYNIRTDKNSPKIRGKYNETTNNISDIGRRIEINSPNIILNKSKENDRFNIIGAKNLREISSKTFDIKENKKNKDKEKNLEITSKYIVERDQPEILSNRIKSIETGIENIYESKPKLIEIEKPQILSSGITSIYTDIKKKIESRPKPEDIISKPPTILPKIEEKNLVKPLYTINEHLPQTNIPTININTKYDRFSYKSTDNKKQPSERKEIKVNRSMLKEIEVPLGINKKTIDIEDKGYKHLTFGIQKGQHKSGIASDKNILNNPLIH